MQLVTEAKFASLQQDAGSLAGTHPFHSVQVDLEGVRCHVLLCEGTCNTRTLTSVQETSRT